MDFIKTTSLNSHHISKMFRAFFLVVFIISQVMEASLNHLKFILYLNVQLMSK
jgi:hypothetical protein